LSILQILLNQLAEQGQYIQPYNNNDDEIIVEKNNFINITPDTKTTLHTIRIPIKHTDWYIQAHIEKNISIGILIYISLTNAILFIILSFIFFIFSSRLSNIFASDFKTVQKLLKSLKDDTMTTTEVHYKLLETDGLVHEIQNIADDISSYQHQLVQFSQCDDLTGLLNRRDFFNEAPHAIDLANRSIESTLIIIDIDYFKQINDTLGHATGDKILPLLSSCIKATSRSIDISARIGGDKFVIIMVKCNAEHAINWYNNISEDFLHQQQKLLEITGVTRYCSLSAGFALIEKNDQDISQTLYRADEALYSAKETGRSNIKGYTTD